MFHYHFHLWPYFDSSKGSCTAAWRYHFYFKDFLNILLFLFLWLVWNLTVCSTMVCCGSVVVNRIPSTDSVFIVMPFAILLTLDYIETKHYAKLMIYTNFDRSFKAFESLIVTCTFIKDWLIFVVNHFCSVFIDF